MTSRSKRETLAARRRGISFCDPGGHRLDLVTPGIRPNYCAR
jgi:hypothetical protein